MRLAAEQGLPVVATHPVQFLDRDGFQAHEARVYSPRQILANRGGCGATRRTNTCQFRGNGAPLRRRALGANQYGRDRAARNLTLVLGKPRLPNFPRRTA